MAITTQRVGMVQIPLHAWAIFCTAVDSDAVPQGEMRTFTRSLLGTYFPTTQTNGAAGNAAQAKQKEGASQPTRKASNATGTKLQATRGTRIRAARTGSRREQLVSLIQANSEGLARGAILEKLGLKGDSKAEMSVSNALTALTKDGIFLRSANRGYCPGPNIGAVTQEARQLEDA